MKPPLELTVYPLLPKVGRMAEPGYIVNRKAEPEWTVDYRIAEKRFTGAELAAEFWCEWKNHDDWREIAKTYPHYADLVPELLARTLAFQRFAESPHWDEAPGE